MDYLVGHKLQQCASTTTSPSHLQFYHSDMTKFDVFNPSLPLSSSPPEYPTMERKLKKPLMEKKRRKRMNNCFDALKELLLQSDLQQSSKLEKADVLEKTVAYMTSLQRENRALQHQIQQILHTEPGQAYHNGIREGFSVCATATSEVLGRMPLPPPLAAPEFRNILRQDIGERLASLLSRGNNISQNSLGCSPPCLPTTSAGTADSTLRPVPYDVPTKKIMQENCFTSPALPPIFVRGKEQEGLHTGLAMNFSFPPPFALAANQLQPVKRPEEVDDFVVVDVESCEPAVAANRYSPAQANDSGIYSPPTSLSPHAKTSQQVNCGDGSQTSQFNQASVSLVYRSTCSSSQKKQRKEVWKPYERF